MYFPFKGIIWSNTHLSSTFLDFEERLKKELRLLRSDENFVVHKSAKAEMDVVNGGIEYSKRRSFLAEAYDLSIKHGLGSALRS